MKKLPCFSCVKWMQGGATCCGATIAACAASKHNNPVRIYGFDEPSHNLVKLRIIYGNGKHSPQP